MLEGFKTFLMRGNVADLAIGVVIGASFGDVVNSLVKDVLTPLVSGIFHQPDFSKLALTINGSHIMYGNFLNYAISFVIVAFSIYFLVVVPLNKLFAKMGIKAEITGKQQ